MQVKAGHIAQITPTTDSLDVIKPLITSFSLIDIQSGKPLPGYEEITGDTLISRKELPAGGIGIRANISGDTDMVEIKRPDYKQQVRQELQTHPDKNIEPEYVGYRAIDTTINPFPVEATPYSRNEGRGNSEQLRIFFDD